MTVVNRMIYVRPNDNEIVFAYVEADEVVDDFTGEIKLPTVTQVLWQDREAPSLSEFMRTEIGDIIKTNGQFSTVHDVSYPPSVNFIIQRKRDFISDDGMYAWHGGGKPRWIFESTWAVRELLKIDGLLWVEYADHPLRGK